MRKEDQPIGLNTWFGRILFLLAITISALSSAGVIYVIFTLIDRAF